MKKRISLTLKFFQPGWVCMYVCLFVCLISMPLTTEAQTASDFETRMKAYTDSYIEKNTNRYTTEKTIMNEDMETISEEDFKAYLVEEAKSKFIQDNMKEYMNVYFPPSAMVAGDTFICSNGGFEGGFLNYIGYISVYNFGSTTCTPSQNGIPIVYNPVTIPKTNRFEIVNSGQDPLVGIQQVRFGNKAARINNKYGHVHKCSGDRGIDKLTKRFRVTKENREFTVWYAVVLENPVGHENSQPFFNIKCDRDPQNELCFDAKILRCDQYFEHECQFDSLDVLNWTCHRFKIPKQFIDSIATLDIVAADCGLGEHFGYAYIDGICEECDNSTLGSVKIYHINDSLQCKSEIVKVCGSFTLPDLCNDNRTWTFSSFSVPGYNIINLEIDTANQTFCFDFPLSNFTTVENCLDVYAEIIFTDGVTQLPNVLSNSIEVCKSDYGFDVTDFEISQCFDNGTADILSDDYYFVYLKVLNTNNVPWYVEKHLVYPYPNEEGISTIYEGQTDAFLELGPFLIQDGDWWLHVKNGSADCIKYIEAPPFCSGCDKFDGLKITNIQCYDNGTWSFDYYVSGNSNETYDLENQYNRFFNNTYSYPPTALTMNCLDLDLFWHRGQIDECKNTVIVCPPKPCDPEVRCDLEVNVANIDCYKDRNGNVEYIVTLDISGEGDKQICYQTRTVASPPLNPNNNGQGSISNLTYPIIGPFTEDIYLTIYLCDRGVNCTTTVCDECFKTIYIPKPDCIERGRGIGKRSVTSNSSSKELKVVPNPVTIDEFLLISELKETHYSIFDVSGHQLINGNFTGKESKLKVDFPPGTYLIRYSDGNNTPNAIKFLKF